MSSLEEDLFRVLFARSDLPSRDMSRAWIQVQSPALTAAFDGLPRIGKWCVFCTEAEVDDAWARVKALVQAGSIVLAKVATRAQACRRITDKAPSLRFVICAYTEDWLDETDLVRTREVLRTAGFATPLNYKRDLETRQRVYGSDDEFYLTR